MKTIVMEIISKCCGSSVRKVYGCVVVIFMLGNIVMFGLCVFLYLQLMQDQICMDNQPHTYFIQVYLVVNTLIYVVLVLVMVSVNCDGQTMTVLGQH